MAIPEKRTDLRGADAFLGVVTDQLDAVFGGKLEPVRGSAAVWGSGSGNALAWGVETAHFKGRNRRNRRSWRDLRGDKIEKQIQLLSIVLIIYLLMILLEEFPELMNKSIDIHSFVLSVFGIFPR